MDTTDEAAPRDFDRFVSIHSSDWHRLCLALTCSKERADDLLQESLLRCYLRWPRIGSMDNPSAYIRRVIVTQHVSLWRSSRWTQNGVHPVETRTLEALAEVARQSRNSPCVTDKVLDRHVLKLALQTLPPRQRAVMVLYYLEDLGEEQIADILHCRTNTIKSHRAKALKSLRSILVSDMNLDVHVTNPLEGER